VRRQLLAKKLFAGDPQESLPPLGFSGVSSPQRARLEILAALLFAKLKGEATVVQEDDDTLKIELENRQWKVRVRGTKVGISGSYNSGLTQHIGSLGDDIRDIENDLTSCVENAITLIKEDLNRKEISPIKFESTSEAAPAKIPATPAVESESGGGFLGQAPGVEEPTDSEIPPEDDFSDLLSPDLGSAGEEPYPMGSDMGGTPNPMAPPQQVQPSLPSATPNTPNTPNTQYSPGF